MLASVAKLGRSCHQRPDLHRVQAWLDHAEAHATSTDHRVVLGPTLGGGEQALFLLREALLGLLHTQFLDGREELVQRWIEQADCDRQAVHRFEDLLEVGLLCGAQLLQSLGFLGRRVGEDHLTHNREAVRGEEHVLGAAQPDSLGAQLACVGGIFAGVGVGAHGQLALADRIGPGEDRVELGRRLGSSHFERTQHDLSCRAVERDDIALLDDDVADRELVAVDLDRISTDDRRSTPTSGNDSSVADEPTASGQDSLRHHHAVDVFRAGLIANEDDGLTLLGCDDGVVSGEVDLADSGTWRSAEACGDWLALAGELGVQHRIEMLGRDPRNGLFASDLPSTTRTVLGALGHLDGHRQRGRAGALANTSLEHPQLALLDRELGVAHVGVVRFEAGEDRHQFLVVDRELVLHVVERLGVTDTRHDVLTLCIHEEVAVRQVLTSCRIASEANACRRILVAVAEHHRLNVDGGAEVVADLLAYAICDRPSTIPASEHCLDSTVELGPRILRERLSGRLLDSCLVPFAEILQNRHRKIGVVVRMGVVFGGFQRVLKRIATHPEHDPSVHRDETTVRVVRKPLVARDIREPLDALVVETQIEDGVHHAGHREFGARTNAYEQRIVRITQPTSHVTFQLGDMLRHLRIQLGRPATVHVVTASIGRHSEAWWHRQLQHSGHLGEVGTLTTQQILVGHGGLAMLVIKGIDVRHGSKV